MGVGKELITHKTRCCDIESFFFYVTEVFDDEIIIISCDSFTYSQTGRSFAILQTKLLKINRTYALFFANKGYKVPCIFNCNVIALWTL